MSIHVADPVRTENGVYQDSLSTTLIPSEDAVRKAKNYLTKYVSLHFRSSEPILLPCVSIIGERPVWQVLVCFKTYGLAPYRLGFLDIDAVTGDVTPFAEDHKQLLIARANAYFARNAPETAAAE